MNTKLSICSLKNSLQERNVYSLFLSLYEHHKEDMFFSYVISCNPQKTDMNILIPFYI